MDAHTCLNCDNEYAGKFCPQCGQKSHTHRYTFAAILHDIPHSVFHVDRGLMYTFRQLMYRPGKAIKEFLTGKRVDHFSPFAYLILLCAIRTFIHHQTYAFSIANTGDSTFELVVSREVAIFFAKYPALMLCAIVPFLSFWSWILNLHSKYNYWENFILNVYLVAQFNIFFIISIILSSLTGIIQGSMTPMITAFILYLSFAYYQFFPRERSIRFYITRVLLFIAITFTFLNGLTFTGAMSRWWW
ncbi:MAG: DUF3667 domain-containing protein [Sphingobacteriales bacterium]|nr:MAG: DUF3667 domain-containing protein [Sphingobacteriales bacterium]